MLMIKIKNNCFLRIPFYTQVPNVEQWHSVRTAEFETSK
jgi:hypothetical protein